ncbi:hypothetical protein OH76DRAFT_1417160 [Lentinus brumalis]|uniref:F-box domain-containing protein n=1 Tax=Lentinus brumalis TaxID=2498619 RepID=A0A371DH20_9APHY|nr:hypothetical protein OH76DRAFT_1417160 [Polyporus brumalis]
MQLLSSISVLQSILPGLQAQSHTSGHTTVHRLPNEILIAIFKEVLSGYQRGATYRLDGREDAWVDTSALVKLTHVCRRWRDTALYYPPLWTRINGQHRGRLQAFLERSHGAPLSLYLHTGLRDLRDILLRNASRLKRLDLNILTGMDKTQWSGLTTIMADSLECFTLSGRCFDEETRSLTHTLLFGRESLPLKALAVYRMCGWVPVNSFPGLTHLYIAFVPRVAYPITALFQVLRAAARLQYVHLSSVPDCSAEKKLETSISLPDVRSLVITQSYMDNAFHLVSTLSLPRNAYVRLDDLDFNLFHGLPPLPCLPVTEEANQLYILVQGSFLRMICEGPSSGLWVQMGYDLLNDHDASLLDEWLSSLPSTLRLEQITSLRLCTGDHPQIFQMLLPYLPRLSDLRVFFDIQYERESAHGRTAVAPVLYSSLGQDTPFLVPHLESMSVEIECGPLHVAPDVAADELGCMLAARASKGCPVQTFTIRPFAGCKWADEDVFSIVDRGLSTIRDRHQIVVVPPSPARLPSYERERCWESEEAEKYWELSNSDKPGVYLKFLP